MREKDTAALPSVVIVGRPNVGKSTLFNRLTSSRRSIVTNEPGITRDRIYGIATWQGRPFQVVDTGGIVPDDKAAIPKEILRQAHVAIASADVLVLVVDSRAGVTPLDEELAQLLRRTGKRLLVAANKVDAQTQVSAAAPFYALAQDVFPIAAEHGTGVDDLLDAVTRDFPDAPQETAGEELNIAIIGRPNVGKSTLLNRLVGEERAIVSAEPGTTRDAVDTLLHYGGKAYRFVDTAGIRRKGKTKLVAEKLSVVMARKNLERADIALVLVDAAQGVTSNDATIASYAEQSGRSVIVVMNKWDLAQQAWDEARTAGILPDYSRSAGARGEHGRTISPARLLRQGTASAVPMRSKKRRVASAAEVNVGPQRLLEEYEKIVRAKLKFLDYAPIIFLSALTGEHTEKLFSLIDRVAAARTRRISTGEMNRWLERVDLARGTSPAGREMKIFYVTQASTAPPTFVLFTNQARPMHFSYQRFLENQLRAHFDFTGTPIRFHIRLKKR
ncbi:MAG TPA: ribosome biogenesis GTPase Der [Candidatus Acidoferrales bacterium]|nr:ribosome biogenesis GTPase Der [Candidatus Acidoferrales bacterium]